MILKESMMFLLGEIILWRKNNMNEEMKKTKTINYAYLTVMLVLGTYFIWIEDWLWITKIIIFVALVLVLKWIVFPKKK